MKKVAPATPVAPWLGGKRALHEQIIARIDRIPHDTYVEPFVGMGGVFLRRKWQPKCEVANDLNGEITNLFRVLQRHHRQLMEVMRFQVTSRQEFDRLRDCDPATLTDLERAARFLYLQRLCFGGRPGGVFGVAADRGSRFTIDRMGTVLEAAHARLDGVILECLPWQEVMKRWDSSGTLFYLDPPYWGGENDYGKGLFAREHYQEMAALLAGLKGGFVLSINDVPEIREIFAAFRMEPVSLTYSISRKGPKEAAELIISNREVATGLI